MDQAAAWIRATATAFVLAVLPAKADPVEERIARVLDAVPAVDNHTHLLRPAPPYDPRFETLVPVLLRSTRPETVAILKSRFGVDWDPARGRELDQRGREARAELVRRAGGEPAYWREHMALARTEVVLVNQDLAAGTDGKALLWVPYATTIAVPFANEAYVARHPGAASQMRNAVAANAALWKSHGVEEAPVMLEGYLALIDRILARYKAEGAVAVKLSDAYYRSLKFSQVPRARAEALYGKARSRSADRDEYLAMQDYLYRHIFRRCGELGLAVHIHSSHGAGPFLRLQESDVRLLEDVVSDPAFFTTHFVLIHGGAPWHEAAAYMAAAKEHVWIDLSAMPFLYPVPEMAQVIRKYLAFAPERTLFGTDPMAAAMIPIGPEVAHLMLTQVLRRALYRALAGMVADGMVTESRALEMGRGVLRDNARRLYKLP